MLILSIKILIFVLYYFYKIVIKFDMKLTQLKKGNLARISGFEVESIPLKLLEMGCLPGNNIELIQKAPFGDPLCFRINDTNVAIRIETAQNIFIDLINE